MRFFLLQLYMTSLFHSSLAILSQEEMSLTMIVEARKRECVFIPVTKDTYRSMEINYRVVGGGSHDISLSVRVPSGVEVINDQRSRSHAHKIALDGSSNSLGDYQICLDNEFSTVSQKTVSLSIYLLDEFGNYPNDLVKITRNPTAELMVAAEVFEATTMHIKSNLNRMESEMTLIRTITLADRSRAEDNFEAVNFWGIVNSIVLLIAGATQVFLVRSLLTDRSAVGRFLRGEKKPF